MIDTRIVALVLGIFMLREWLDGDMIVAGALMLYSIALVIISDIRYGAEWRWFK